MFYSYVCPICNGFQELHSTCEHCGAQAEDCGRASDFYGPYSPYRPIDDQKLTNGFPDLQQHQCIHALYCPSCGATFTQAVNEA